MGVVNLAEDAPSAAAVLTAFDLPGEVLDMTEVAGAWSNRVYRLATRHGTFAVKELRNPWSDPGWRDWLDAAWDFERIALAAGVSMPEPVPNPSDGSCLAWVKRRSGTGSAPVRVHRWVSGVAPGPGPVAIDVARWAGELLVTLHGLDIRPADRGVFPVTTTASADRWPELVQLARRADAPWAVTLADLLPAVQVIVHLAEAAGSRPAEEVMTHGDIDQKNLLLTSAGPVLCDWDVAAPLVPHRELADVAMSLGGWDRHDVVREVVGGYREAVGHDIQLQPEDLGQSLMIGLDWIALNVERAVGARPADPRDAELGSRLVPALLAELPGHVAAAQHLGDILGDQH